jgi:DNA polymerase IV
MSLSRLFVDFNSFFASVEQQERPELRGRPVGVVPTLADTTCCIAASYEAKRHGVKTGTLVREAKKLSPGIVLVEARHEIYVKYHHALVDAVDTVLPVMSVMSIDEMLCELPARWQAPDKARAKAAEVKRAVAVAGGAHVKCSIGIASNMFLAKTASDMQKPDGLTVLQQTDLPQALYRLELRDLYGIGPQMEQRLQRHGIRTVEQLCATPRERLHQIWGGVGGDIFFARLRGEEPPQPPEQRGSVGHSHVLPPAQRNSEDARAVIHRMLQKAAVRLRALGDAAAGLWVVVKYVDGDAWGEEARFGATQDTLELTHILNAVWVRRPKKRAAPLAVGVTLVRLMPAEGRTLDLFGPDRRRDALNQTLDRVNLRFGTNAVYFGASARALGAAPMRIAFTRIPDPDLEL